MLNKYHDVIFTVTKVRNNGLTVINPEGKEYYPKKEYCLKINNVIVHEVEEPIKNINEKIINVGKKNKQTTILKKEEQLEENTLTEKRIKKPNQLFVWKWIFINFQKRHFIFH